MSNKRQMLGEISQLRHENERLKQQLESGEGHQQFRGLKDDGDAAMQLIKENKALGAQIATLTTEKVTPEARAIASYNAGMKEGWRLYGEIMSRLMPPITNNFQNASAASSAIRALVLPEAGEINRQLVHRFSGELARHVKLTQQAIMEAQTLLGDPNFHENFNFGELFETMKAADHFYATGDPSRLRAIGNDHPIVKESAFLRDSIGRGRKKESAIGLLVERAKYLSNTSDMTQEEITHHIYDNLHTRLDTLNRAEKGMLKKLNQWNGGGGMHDNLWRNVRRSEE